MSCEPNAARATFAWAIALSLACFCATEVVAQPVAPTQLARHAGADVNEWSAFVAAPAVPDGGPVPEATWRALQQGGPWAPLPASGLLPAQQEAMGLAFAGRWPEVLKLLKDEGIQPDFRDEQGRTLLTLAAQVGDLPAVRGLLGQGAEPERQGTRGMTPLGMAAWQGHELVVRELLLVGAQVDRIDARGQTALHLAAQMGQLRVMDMLIRAGAPLDGFDREGFTPLHEAARLGQVPAMQRLVKAGVPLMQLDRKGLNAVHAAALAEQGSTVHWLVDQGVPVQGAITQVLIDTMGRREPVVR